MGVSGLPPRRFMRVVCVCVCLFGFGVCSNPVKQQLASFWICWLTVLLLLESKSKHEPEASSKGMRMHAPSYDTAARQSNMT